MVSLRQTGGFVVVRFIARYNITRRYLRMSILRVAVKSPAENV